jgi:18S rRNA (guanine1575-N7)-methyltransferase
MGHGIPFRGATFDGAISVSALQVSMLSRLRLCRVTCCQWLCNADFTGANPYKRLNTFFSGLYHTLKRGAKAVLQW